jgi:hypothetical protein
VRSENPNVGASSDPSANPTSSAFTSHTAATKHLRDRGYLLTPSWNWIPPAGLDEPSPEDRAAADYLFHEWDWGHIVQVKRCPFCGGQCDPRAPAGPLCRECEATTPTLAAWQRRV